MALKRIAKEANEMKEDGTFELRMDEDDPHVWTVSVRGGLVKVMFPPEYPFRPPKFRSLPLTPDGSPAPLRHFLFFGADVIRDQWSPALTVMRLLKIEPPPGYADHAIDDVDVSSITADTAAVYIGVGVGGCDNGVRFPKEMQAAVDTRGHCFFLLIDPRLRLVSGQPRRTCRTDPDTNVTVVLEEAPLYAEDLDPMRKLLTNIRSRTRAPIYMTDRRGASFRGIEWPLTDAAGVKDMVKTRVTGDWDVSTASRRCKDVMRVILEEVLCSKGDVTPEELAVNCSGIGSHMPSYGLSMVFRYGPAPVQHPPRIQSMVAFYSRTSAPFLV